MRRIQCSHSKEWFVPEKEYRALEARLAQAQAGFESMDGAYTRALDHLSALLEEKDKTRAEMREALKPFLRLARIAEGMK